MAPPIKLGLRISLAHATQDIGRITPWTPELITTAAWYDAADSNTIVESGGAVSQWYDKSGNSIHLTQINGADQPSTGVDTINSKNVLSFDSGENINNTAVGSSYTTGLMAISVNKIGAASTEAEHYYLYDSGVITDKLRLFQKSGGAGAGLRQKYSFGEGGIESNPSSDWDGVDSPDYRGVVVLNSLVWNQPEGTGQAYINGSLDTDTSPIGTGTFSHDGTWIGKTSGVDADTSNIAEIVIVPDNITEETRQLIEGYLAWKWGLEADLPLDHPFKNGEPDSNGNATVPANSIWSPASINTTGWYDASDANTITEISGNVSQIDDKSGNELHLAQASGGLQPVWGLGDQINGLNVLHFSDTLDYIWKQGIADIDLSEVSILSVGMAKTAGDYPALGYLRKTDGTDVLDLRLRSTATSGQFSANVKLDNVGGTIASANLPSMAEEVPCMVALSYDGVNGIARTNGTQVATNTPAAGATFTINEIKMGRNSNTPKNYHGEMIVVPTADLATIQLCEGYLAHKWGLEADLPLSHPYKTNPPFTSPSILTYEGDTMLYEGDRLIF